MPAALLSPAETRALLARAQAGDREARDRLVEANLRLVASVAQRFVGRGIEFEDLFQIGCLGLVKAIDRFDLRYDVRFSTYAVPVIIGEIRQRRLFGAASRSEQKTPGYLERSWSIGVYTSFLPTPPLKTGVL